MTFYDIFQELCREHGTTPNAVCKELGFSNSVATYWKKAKNPPKREFLDKIAKRFNVSSDYLLGREPKHAPAEGESEIPDDLEMIALKATRTVWREIISQMSRENKVKLLEYARLLLLSQDQADPKDQ